MSSGQHPHMGASVPGSGGSSLRRHTLPPVPDYSYPAMGHTEILARLTWPGVARKAVQCKPSAGKEERLCFAVWTKGAVVALMWWLMLRPCDGHVEANVMANFCLWCLVLVFPHNASTRLPFVGVIQAELCCVDQWFAEDCKGCLHPWISHIGFAKGA
eukprot:1161263-Pelagomonas_calceolata.AAC.37